MALASYHQVQMAWLRPTSVTKMYFAIRVFRIFRLVRNRKFLVKWPGLWMMVTAFSKAGPAIAWAFLFTSGMIFTFAVVGVEWYGSVEENWSSLGPAVLTLCRMATYDDL